MLRSLFLLIIASLATHAATNSVLTSFSTGGHSVYHLRPATVTADGARSVIAAAFDGHVLCYTPEGQLIWKTLTADARPFDMAVADIDGDNLDETFIASADGSLYAIGHDGRPLWTFRRSPPLYQVSTAKLPDGSTVILTGGVGQVLYVLSAQGEVLRSHRTQHCIRHIRTGDILGDGRQFAAVATTDSGLSGTLSLLLIDPATAEVRWRKTGLGDFGFNSGKRFFSMVVADLDKDGRKDIVLSNSWGENGRIDAFNHSGERFLTASDERIPNISYRMILLHHINLPDDEFILGHFANVLILYNLDGTLREVFDNPYSHSNATFDPATRTLYLGSAISGGDGVYALRLDNPGWQSAYRNLRPVGRLARIEKNVERLQQQIDRFERPDYQPEPRTVSVAARQPAGAQFERIHFIDRTMASQKFEDCQEIWCRDTDGRRPYDKTAEQLVQMAREREAIGRDFMVGAGHGHAVYLPLSTMKAMIEAAPKHLYGFLFMEMEGVDAEMEEVVGQIILPLAEFCRKRGKKVVFINKNIFYNGTAYVPFWQKVFGDPRLREVLVPALEETNSRTPELSLMGRMGLWMTGTFQDWAARVVTDNACYDRMWEWSSQQVLVHHLRHLVSRASLGARIYMNNVHQGTYSAALEQQFNPFYEMAEKGVVHIPERDELLSVAPVALGMKAPPSPDYIRHGVNGHHYTYPEDEHPPMVFDRLDTYWGAAPTPQHDLSRYAMNVTWRGTNFLPEYPYGLVTMVPEQAGVRATGLDRKISTDGQYFYDDAGHRHPAPDYKAAVEAALAEAAGKLPIRVYGEVHWTAARLDPTHVRVTLIDPGYFDPAERNAEVVLQHLDGVSCRDILSGEEIPVEHARIRLQVPAGLFRIVDIAHK